MLKQPISTYVCLRDQKLWNYQLISLLIPRWGRREISEHGSEVIMGTIYKRVVGPPSVHAIRFRAWGADA